MAETHHDQALETIRSDMRGANREHTIADALEEHADAHRRYARDYHDHAKRFAEACVEKGYITQDEAAKALDEVARNDGSNAP